ncbi:MAG: DUF4350 domain-containing protein [Actinomycetota bacterium]|nr:DUF4350 domain-containing protein [Actinomycetota bacterium]
MTAAGQQGPGALVAPAARPQWRGWATVGLVVLTALVLLGLILGGFAPAPEGPAESSYATTPAGVAAWAELLDRTGHPVNQLRRPLASAALDPGWTVVVLGASSLSPGDVQSLQRFVRTGGVLVVGGGTPGTSLSALIPDPPQLADSGPKIAHPLSIAPETYGVRTVTAAGEGAWSAGAGQPLLAGRGGVLLLRTRVGAGRIDMLADPSPLENRLLASADNARLALDLAGGGRPVVFAEAIHGYGLATGLAAIPARWWLALAVLGVAIAAWSISRGRRLGPAVALAPLPPPARSTYVGAVAQALTKSRDTDGVTDLARDALERELGRRAAERHSDRAAVLAAVGASDTDIERALEPQASGGAEARGLAIGRILAGMRTTASMRGRR